MTFTSKEKIEIINNGFELIKEKKRYNQTKVVAKLTQLNYVTSSPVFSRIRGRKWEELNDGIINKIFSGFSELLKIELCLYLNEEGKWLEIDNCTPQEILIEEKDPKKRGLQFHTEGRLEIAHKVAFLSVAKKEMIEFGITLNSFTNYLNSRRSKEFRQPILDLLKNNVIIKCYLLDPEWNGTKMYFNDRELVLKEGLTGIEKIKASLRGLKIFHSEIKDKKYSENFEVYTYCHLPNNYFLAIDRGKSSNAKMMVSNYLFGEKRAYCPVLEFSRSDQPILFVRYNESLQKIIKGARKVNFDNIPD